MGFSGMTCAKTLVPLTNCTSKPEFPDGYRVIVLTEDGRRLEGNYDGYMRLVPDELVDTMYQDDTPGVILLREFLPGSQAEYQQMWPVTLKGAKAVLACFYGGESFEQLGPSYNDPAQSHFMSLAAVQELHGRAQLNGRAFATPQEFYEWQRRQERGY